MLSLLIAAALTTAPPPDDWARDRADSAALGAMAKGCELDYDTGLTRGINYDHEVRRYLTAMLKDPPACPGLAQKAAAFVIRSVGTPERADVDIDMLYRAWKLVRDGEFVRADPAVALRYARMIWLFDGPERLKGWPEDEWRRWLEGDEALPLLAARNQGWRERTRQSLLLEAEVRLRRDLPHYDPARAAELLTDNRVMNTPEARRRVVDLWSGGAHLKRDYAKAAAIYRGLAAIGGASGALYRRELFPVARLAAAAARTPDERALALNLLFGSALGGEADAAAARDAMLARMGRITHVELAPGDAEKIGRAVDWDYGWALGSSGAPKPEPLRPILLRALIGRDGRVLTLAVKQSSGSPERDRLAAGVWFEKGRKADLSATARGRMVWVELPPVDPLLTSSDAYRRWNN